MSIERSFSDTTQQCRRFAFGAMAVATLVACGESVRAGWTITRIHPAGYRGSTANAVSGTQVGGHTDSASGYPWRAGFRSDASAVWVDLHPAGATSSRVTGTDGEFQVGETFLGGLNIASLWRGTAASWVDLTPAGSTGSRAYGISGGHQVGQVGWDGIARAARWSGTAESWVDLHPAGAESSFAYATSGNQQVGASQWGVTDRASLWAGSAESWVDLSPGGATDSIAFGTDGTQQVGTVRFGEGNRAALWSGSAESFVNLHPSGLVSGTPMYSGALSTAGGYQVGYVYMSGRERAAVWSGTAESVFFLDTLPGTFGVYSRATQIWTDGQVIRIAGSVINRSTQRNEAVLWTYTVPAPGAVGVFALACLALARRRR